MEPYGVFKRFANGSRLCVGSANNLYVAKAKMEEGARETGLEHFVYDLELEQTVATSSASSRVAGSTTDAISK